jgi:hypothetical protein
MRVSLATLAILLPCTAAGSAVAFSSAAPPAQAARAAGSILLTIGIDARGVSVLQAVRKPDVGYRPARDPETMPFRWVLRDRDGTPVAEGSFDPSRICLDASHAGTPPHLEGDFATPHETHTNIKVPDVPFERIEFQVRQQGPARPFGAARRETLELR